MALNSGDVGEQVLGWTSKKADGAIGAYRLVIAGTDADEVAEASAGTSFLLGISGNGSEVDSTSYTDGQEMSVKTAGRAYLMMSGTGSRHAQITGTTSGYGIDKGTTDDRYIIGFACKSWVNLEVIPVMIRQQYIGDHAA